MHANNTLPSTSKQSCRFTLTVKPVGVGTATPSPMKKRSHCSWRLCSATSACLAPDSLLSLGRFGKRCSSLSEELLGPNLFTPGPWAVSVKHGSNLFTPEPWDVPSLHGPNLFTADLGAFRLSPVRTCPPPNLGTFRQWMVRFFTPGPWGVSVSTISSFA